MPEAGSLSRDGTGRSSFHDFGRQNENSSSSLHGVPPRLGYTHYKRKSPVEESRAEVRLRFAQGLI